MKPASISTAGMTASRNTQKRARRTLLLTGRPYVYVAARQSSDQERAVGGHPSSWLELDTERLEFLSGLNKVGIEAQRLGIVLHCVRAFALNR